MKAGSTTPTMAYDRLLGVEFSKRKCKLGNDFFDNLMDQTTEIVQRSRDGCLMRYRNHDACIKAKE